MSWNPALDPHGPTGAGIDAIETLFVPRARDVGAFEVRRASPSARRQMAEPFIVFDQLGPIDFLTDSGIRLPRGDEAEHIPLHASAAR